jgi:hypothetical protein
MPPIRTNAPRAPVGAGSVDGPARPMRSGDFVPMLSKPMSAAEKKKAGPLADRAIAHQLQAAKAVSDPDLKAVYAEEAGNLLAIRRALAGHPRWDEPDTQKLADQVKGLLNEIVDLRISGMKALAANPAGPEAIRKGEGEAVSLSSDLSRLTRFGFEPRRVDVDALDQAIKKAVVDGVLGRSAGGRGWSPP